MRDILDLEYPNDESDETIVNMIAELSGLQLSIDEYRTVIEHLTAEDYAIAERIFPALYDLVQLVRNQPDRNIANQMAVHLAAAVRSAMSQGLNPRDFDAETQSKMQDCCRLFLDSYLELDEVDDQRYLLTGIASLNGDRAAAKLIDRLAIGEIPD